jgi:hypothetical protein
MSHTFLYILSKLENGEAVPPVKIGISHKPWERLASIQTATPFEVVCFQWFGPFTKEVAREHERGLHEAYADRKAFGEWFNVTADEVLDLLKYELGKSIPGFEAMSLVKQLEALRNL